ncbi:MAG: hypothetical protein V1934_05595 [Methanobacteriota archaeon]
MNFIQTTSGGVDASPEPRDLTTTTGQRSARLERLPVKTALSVLRQ